MTSRQPGSQRRSNRFAIVIAGVLLLLALAAIYVGLAEPLHLWPSATG